MNSAANVEKKRIAKNLTFAQKTRMRHFDKNLKLYDYNIPTEINRNRLAAITS